MYQEIIPAEITSSLENDFKLGESIVFCQMSTVTNGMPHVRTLRLYGIENPHGLIFLTRTTSRKWQDLTHYPHLAICILHPGYHIQLQAECTTNLVRKEDHPNLFQKYWAMVKTDVKKIYHDDYLPNVDYQQSKETTIPTLISSSCGMIMAKPYYWEYLLINDNYPASIRYQFTHDTTHGWTRSRLTMS